MGDDADGDPRIKIIYEEAVRGWSLQSSVLDELRSRSGVLLAAASIVAALLGSADIEKHEGITTLGGFAMGAFILVIVACVYVLWPQKGWMFSHEAKATYKAYVGDDVPLDEMRELLAVKADEYRDGNDKKLKRQFSAFRWASLALGASIVMWLIDLN
jgi:hypothetical protein